jgi:hypothetical protein
MGGIMECQCKLVEKTEPAYIPDYSKYDSFTTGGAISGVFAPVVQYKENMGLCAWECTGSERNNLRGVGIWKIGRLIYLTMT